MFGNNTNGLWRIIVDRGTICWQIFIQMKLKRRRRYGRSVPRHGIHGERELDAEGLAEVRAYLMETGAKGAFRVQELAEVWFGSAGLSLPEVERFARGNERTPL